MQLWSAAPSTVNDILALPLAHCREAGGANERPCLNAAAVEGDGYQFHATSENNRLASDTSKRQGVRASGDLVWYVTWEDVKYFHDAAASELHTQAPDRPLLPLPAHQKAELIHNARHRSPDVDWANRIQ
jgi:hypothetical protein